MTRLLLDQGLPRSTARLLSAAGWDVAHVGDIGLSRAEDLRILEHAREQDRICVTLDADFHALLATSEAKSRRSCPHHPSLITGVEARHSVAA